MKRLLMTMASVVLTFPLLAQTPTRLNISKADGTVISYQIADIDSLWFSSDEETTDTIIPIDKEAYTIEIPADFSENAVMRVMANNVKVAEICYEYINPADERMVVAYPVGEDGDVDLTAGFVVKNGGSVVWDTENNTCEYVEGTSQPFASVYLVNGKIVGKTSAPEIESTKVEADLIIDKRGRDEKKYKTVKIGTQYWMADNLNAVSYINGDGISMYTSAQLASWNANTRGAYHIFADDEDFQNYYGVMYNGYAVESTSGLTPAGWDVPEIDDFQKLKTYLGSQSGQKMKSDLIGDWNYAEDYEPNNLSGFTASGAGYFIPVGGEGDAGLGTDVWYWTKTRLVDSTFGTEGLGTVRLNYKARNFVINTGPHSMNFGHYVRCIKKK